MDSRTELDNECLVITEEAEYTASKQTIEKLQSTNIQLTSENQELSRERDTQNKQIKQLRSENDKLQLDHTDLNEKYVKTTLERDQLITLLDESYKDQTEQLDSIAILSKENTDHQKTIQLLEQEHKRQREELSTLGQLVRSLRQTVIDSQQNTEWLKKECEYQQMTLIKQHPLIKELRQQNEQLTITNRHLSYTKSYAKAVGSKSAFFSEASIHSTLTETISDNKPINAPK